MCKYIPWGQLKEREHRSGIMMPGFKIPLTEKQLLPDLREICICYFFFFLSVACFLPTLHSIYVPHRLKSKLLQETTLSIFILETSFRLYNFKVASSMKNKKIASTYSEILHLTGELAR